MAKKTGAAKKKVVKVEPVGQAHIHASFNNIIISLTNAQGQVIAWGSAGKMGFKGSKKNTPYAAQQAAGECAKNCLRFRSAQGKSVCKRTWFRKGICNPYYPYKWN
jgi:ribosomal protein S11